MVERLGATPSSRPLTMLELGAGGGSLAFHLLRRFRMTLTDRAPAMLDVSRTINPECEHLPGDMQTLRLGREFAVVLVHDAIMYATEAADVRATLRTAAEHRRPGGTVAVLPDFVRETFAADTDHGGRDGPDGRGLRHVEGLFPREQWLAWFAEAGLAAHRSLDPGGRDLFLGLRGEPRG